MKLISILAAGVRGAENGRASIYRRGTTNRLTYYTSFEGDGAVSSGADVVLDTYGRGVVYVDEHPRVIVTDDGGTTVLDVTEGDSSGDVEVQSTSFTGTNYTTGVQTTDEPVDLKSVLDLWRTNAGSPDWKVLINGTAATMQAFANSVVPYINVKAPAYGATGNGTTDDTAAIAAALTAGGGSSGAIVFFPAGTYRVTAALTIPVNTSIMGMGRGQSTVTMDHASANMFTTTAGGSTTISGLTLTHAQTCTGELIHVSTTGHTRIANMTLGSSTLSAPAADGLIWTAGSTSNSVIIEDVRFFWAGNTSRAIYGSDQLRTVITGCVFTTPATYNGIIVDTAHGIQFGNRYICNSTTSGTFACVDAPGSAAAYSGGAALGSVTGCAFRAPTSGSATMLIFEFDGAQANASTLWHEQGNLLPPDSTSAPVVRAYYQGSAAAWAVGAQIVLGSKTGRAMATVTDTEATVDDYWGRVGAIAFTRTTNSNFTINGTATHTAQGDRMLVYFVNNSGATRTITWGTAIVGDGTTASAVANTQIGVFMFQQFAGVWYLTSQILNAV